MGAWLFKIAYPEQDSAHCPFGQDCNFIITSENTHLFHDHMCMAHNGPYLMKPSNTEMHELMCKLDKFIRENRKKPFFKSFISEVYKVVEELEGRFEFFNETQFSLKSLSASTF